MGFSLMEFLRNAGIPFFFVLTRIFGTRPAGIRIGILGKFGDWEDWIGFFDDGIFDDGI